MSYAAIAAALLHSLVSLYSPGQLASVAVPTQAGSGYDTTALDQKCPDNSIYDYTCQFGDESKTEGKVCEQGLAVWNDTLQGKCVGPGKAEGTSYKAANGVWVPFSSNGVPCTTNGDCAPGVNPAQPSYEEGQLTNSFNDYPNGVLLEHDPYLDAGILQLPSAQSPGAVFNETTGQYEITPTNEISQMPMQVYEMPPSEGNIFGLNTGIPKEGPIPSEYEPLSGEKLMVGPNGTVVPQVQVWAQQDADNYYFGFNPLPQDTFTYQPAPSDSASAEPQNKGSPPNIETDLGDSIRAILSDMSLW
jgi:hypothetical protein